MFVQFQKVIRRWAKVEGELYAMDENNIAQL